MFSSYIKDPIYNEINFQDNKWALKLLKTKELIRLSNIKQLGISYKVFPSATNTRFLHSIGTFQVANKFAQHFLKRFNVSQYDIKIFLASALLHDIGHGPFSHAFEKITNIKHENITKNLILDKNMSIYKILIEENIDPLDVVSVLNGKYKKDWINKLISSNLDVDRIDYMLRDAYFLGTKYSTIDIDFLVERSYIINDNIYFSEKTSNVIESFLLGRYYMHNDIYDNKNTYSYEWSLNMIFLRLKEIKDQFKLKKEKIYFFNLYSWIIFETKLENDIFIQLNDYNFISFLESLFFLDDYILNSFIKYFKSGNLFLEKETISVENFSLELKEKLKLKISKIDKKYLYLILQKNNKEFYYENENDKIILFNENNKSFKEFPYKGLLDFHRKKSKDSHKLILINNKLFS